MNINQSGSVPKKLKTMDGKLTSLWAKTTGTELASSSVPADASSSRSNNTSATETSTVEGNSSQPSSSDRPNSRPSVPLILPSAPHHVAPSNVPAQVLIKAGGKTKGAINGSPWGYFSIIVDETTDVAGSEQVSICVRFVDPDLLPTEVFLGLYDTASTTGESLCEIISVGLQQFGLPLKNLRGQCYDGAANMSGQFKGVKARILNDHPKALYVHCVNHSLNLAIQDSSKAVHLVRDCLQVVNDVGCLIHDSAQRISVFKDNANTMDVQETTVPKPLCRTRWVIHGKAISSIHSQYEVIMRTLQEIASKNTGRQEAGAKAAGLLCQLEKSSMYLALIMAEVVFHKTEMLATALQNPNMTVAGARECAAKVMEFLRGIRTDDYFHDLWTQASTASEELDLLACQLPRAKRVPKRLEYGDNPSAAHVPPSAEEHFRTIYFEFIDNVLAGIVDRFNQPNMTLLERLEKCLLLKDANILPQEYHDEFNAQRLQNEFDLFDSPSSCLTVDSVATYFQNMEKGERQIFSQVEKLLRQILVVPPTSATAERSFSCLRRLLTWLRSTMSQCRLNHLALLHTHREKTKELDLKIILEQFLCRDNRCNIFGPP